MQFNGIKQIIKSVLVSLITGAFFLSPVENASADAIINLNQVFSATNGLSRTFMENGGTWDGTSVISPNNGDNFTLSYINNASNADILGNTAYDIAITLDVGPGIRVPAEPFTVNVTASQLSTTACPAIGGTVRARQPGGAGALVTIDLPANTDIRPQCLYDFEFELTTNFEFPYASPGNPAFNYTTTWSNQDGTPLNPQLSATFTDVEIRNGGALAVTKTVTTPLVVDGNPVNFNVSIRNTSATAGLFDIDFADILGANLTNIQIDLPGPFDPPLGQSTYQFLGYLAPNQSYDFIVRSDALIDPNSGTCELDNTAQALDVTAQVFGSGSDSASYNFTNALTLTHDLVNSYCLLCGQGEVVLRVANTSGITLTDIDVSINLSAALPAAQSGLTFSPVPAPTVTVISGGSATFVMGPASLSGVNNSTVSFNLNVLDSPFDLSPSEPTEVEIRFRIERATGFGFNLEDLADPALTNLSYQTTATFDSACGPSAIPGASSTLDILPLRQPEPVVTKNGWNVDAGQDETTAGPFVYGHQDDDVIWQIDITNNGLADLEDLLIQDTIGGNFEFTDICLTLGDAVAAATGGANACTAVSPATGTPPDFLPAPNPGIDVAIGTTTSIYYVGKILSLCSPAVDANAINRTDIQWGCEADAPPPDPGGINSLNSSIPLIDTFSTAGLNTDVSGADLPGAATNTLDVNVVITGTHPTNRFATGQPAGGRGRVTVVITNNTGGTVRDITLDDVLPPNVYVVDPTIDNQGANVNPATTVNNTPAFDLQVIPANGVGSYDGMVDTVEWTNPNGNPLLNGSPHFEFTSSVPGAGAFQDNLLRHGDEITLSFDIVLIDSVRYDLIADLDVVPESQADGSDPNNGETILPTPGFPIDNVLTVDYSEACAVADTLQEVRNNTFTAFPEDIDIDFIDPVSGFPSLEFIINPDPLIQLPLRVQLTNNGGHDALDYFAVVTFGNAMKVDIAPANCTDISGPPLNLPRPYWDNPVPIPPDTESPTVYQCDFEGFGILTPINDGGIPLDLDFTVSRNAASTIDDLTFRADVVGEIQLSNRSAANLSDGTALDFPAVAVVPIVNVANNYSLDALRAKVIGFGLTKALEGDCTEFATAPGINEEVLIGEDCKFKIRSGGWFGFDTPGFGIIAVHNITVFDQLPDGQGFISHTNGGLTTVGGGSDTEIKNIQFGSGSAPFVIGPVPQLTEDTAVGWNFNLAPEKLLVKDKFFRTDITTRILNDGVDNSVAPNLHDVPSRNILNSTFDADYSGGITSFGPDTPGYPAEILRRYDLTITEPNLIVDKTVCNETLAGGPGACTDADFSDFVNTGDTQDLYVYRIRITNDDPLGPPSGVLRAPAYNVVVRDILDSKDLMQVYPIESPPLADPLTYPFNNDGLDNDGDGNADTLDLNGEGRILTDNDVNVLPVVPGEIEFSYTTTDALLQIDDGEVVDLFYRVDPDDSIAPLLLMTNTVSTVYDTLLGDASNQNATQVIAGATDGTTANVIPGSAGSARVLRTAGETARVQILPVTVERKEIIQTSLQAGTVASPLAGQGPVTLSVDVVPGEEVEFLLRTLIPVANLRQFQIRDELPPGLRCVDAPSINLDLPPFDAAGFVPGGTFTPSCDETGLNNVVLWNFGNQELTTAQDDNLFEFIVKFVARVENTPLTQAGCVVRNGGGALPQVITPPLQVCNVDTYVATSYENDPSQGSQIIEILIDPVEVNVTEPQLQVTKTIVEVNSGIPGIDEVLVDAKDILEVRVDIVNNGDAAAYNPQILDNLTNTNYTYAGNVSAGIPANIPSSDGAITLPAPGSGLPGTNQPVFSWPAGYNILPGAANAISFTYRVEVNDTVEPIENILNMIDGKWTTLDSNAVAINSSGLIGADGTDLGMRIGYFPGEITPDNALNDYIDNDTDSVDVPPLQFTKVDLDFQVDNLDVTRTIGEHRRYQLEITLPQGITTGVSITDNIAFGDVSYVLENLAPFAVQYEFFDIQTINGQPAINANAETIFNSAPIDETPNNVLWDIGTVVTEAEDNSPLNLTPTLNPRIRITYYARVNNDVDTNNGLNLRNEATLQYTSGLVPPTTETITAATANVGVIESLLDVTKVPSIVSGAAGDAIQYTVTISHNALSTADAFDVNIVDTLPVSLVFTSADSLLINGIVTGTLVPTVAGQQLTWGRNNLGDDTLDIPLGETLELVYTVTISDLVQPLELIQNSVVVDWTSIDGDITGLERIGIGGLNCLLSVPPDDYCVGPIRADVSVLDANEVVKTVVSDTSLIPLDGNLRIGDIITYALTITLQEGTTRSLSLVDTLSNGLEVLDIVSINGDLDADNNNIYEPVPANGFAYANITGPILPTGPGNNVLTFNLGDITNQAGVGMIDFVIIYRAVVTKDEFVLPQPLIPNTPVTNTVVMDYLDANGLPTSAPPLTRLTSTTNLNVQEPVIFLADLSKTRRTGQVSGTSVVPGETVEFQLEACNSGTAPAYNLVLEDVLPQYDAIGLSALFDFSTLSVPIVRINGVIVADTVEYNYAPPVVALPTTPAGLMVFSFTDAGIILPGQCATVEFDIDVHALVGSQINWDNQLQVNTYYSIPSGDLLADVTQRQVYNPEGPVLFAMNTVLPINDPEKALISTPGLEATIGEEITYQIKVPGDGAGPMQVNLFNVEVFDPLVENVTFVSAVLDGTSQYTGPFTTSVSLANELIIAVPVINFNPALAIPGTEQAVFNVTVRVNNDAITSSIVAPITPPFGNSVKFSFTGPGGVGLTETIFGTTLNTNDISIVEPQLTLASKSVTNLTQAGVDTNAGDVLRYVLVINSSNGAPYSDAFDIDIMDQLSPGLEFCSAIDGGLCANPISTNSATGADVIASTPTVITGTGLIGNPYVLNWNSVNASATDIDIPENTTTTITYTVRVMDSVLANQQLSNSATIRWTSIDGVNAFERNGEVITPADRRYISGPVLSDNIYTVPDINTLTKALSATSSTLAGANDVRIGDVVDYELTINLQEGTSQNFTIIDNLPKGLQYEGIVSVEINGVVDNDGLFEAPAPASVIQFATFDQSVALISGNPLTGPSTVNLTLGDVTNTGNNITTDDTLVIVYRTRVLDLVQTPLNAPLSNINLTNSVTLNYRTAIGTSTDTANTATVFIDQPSIAITKLLGPAPPAVPADPVVIADEVLTFYVDITNSGESPAYDLVLQDILPLGLRNGIAPPVVTNVEMPIGTNIAPRPIQTYTAANGVVVWDFNTGVANELTINQGETLRVTYQVQADSNIGTGISVNNLAQAVRYYSFDDQELPIPPNVTTGAAANTQILPPEVDDREQYGPSNNSSVNITTDGPGELYKSVVNNLDVVSIGQSFKYRIQVPLVAVPTALYDVRIFDDLTVIPNTELIFVSVAAVDDDGLVAPPDEDDNYIPVNSGTPTNLVIEDLVTGIDIPANETITVEVEVMLRDMPVNSGLPLPAGTFINTADYTFNSLDNVPASVGNGMPGMSTLITIVEPVLEISKTGPADPAVYNAPIPYTVVVENTGTGPAYDTTITDILPIVADNPPRTGGTCNTAPTNVTAQIVKDDDTVVSVLALGTDFNFIHTPAPACSLVITTLSSLAKIEFDEKLVVSYETYLDIDSLNGALLTNNVSVTEYFSQDTPEGVKVGEIRRYENNPASDVDEANYQIVVAAPELVITKVPYNLSTGGDGAFADPGDQLRYAIMMQNIGPIATGPFSFTDQPDRLNLAPGYFDFASITNVLVNKAIVPFTAVDGVLTIPDLNVDQAGGANETLLIEFDINLIDIITAGTVVLNQGEVAVTGFSPQLTDDPSIAAVPGVADPTETLIDAAPAFLITKRSEDLTDDVNILRQGDTLRYTLEVKNIGLEHVNNAYLRDLVPANTSYVSGSTTLNGLPVVDDENGASPLENEILINAPEDLTPGNLRASADLNDTANVATITFDVVVDADVIDGTVISNQGYAGGLGEGSGPVAEQTSDNPDTSLANDPTINVVGNLPALDAQKSVSLFTDVNNNGALDQDDVLEYTIVVANGGAIAATQVRLIDDLNAITTNSTYVANSLTLNGNAIPDTDIFPNSPTVLEVSLNSGDLGLPDQAANDGQISAGNEAIIRFRVIASGASNSLIANQGMIISNELPDQFTDADGNSLNGDQPTEIYISAIGELQITKEVFVVGGGVAQAGGTLEYVIEVTNTGFADVFDIQLTDVLPANVTYTIDSGKLNGSTTFIGSGVTEPINPGGSLLVNYQLAKGSLGAGEKFTLAYRVVSDETLVPGSEIRNTASVIWQGVTDAKSDTALIEIGGAPGIGVVGGNIWHDIVRTPAGTFTDGTDLNLQDWTVQLYLNNPARNLFASTTTDENGHYQFIGLPPSTSGGEYELRIIQPGGSDTSASLGRGFADVMHGADSGTIAEMGLTRITVNPGANIANENLPIIPHGVIYDSVFREPVTGATLRLLQTNGNLVPANCLPAGSNQREQTSLSNGFYRFDIQAASCGITDFVIEVSEVPSGYIGGTSRIIPPGKAGNVEINVATCSDSSDDTIRGNNDCDIQFSVTPPDISVVVRTDSTEEGIEGESQGTTYYLSKRVNINGEVAFNNHIPLDPDISTSISISKISPMVNVTRSQLVPYTITLVNTEAVPLFDLNVDDYFPAGFKYVAGSGRVQSSSGTWVKKEPLLDPSDPQRLTLTWEDIGILNGNATFKVNFLLVVGSGVGEGEYVNRTRVLNNRTGGFASGEASATVRVVPDPTFDCSDVIGKVFDDKNLNAYQDEGEEGLPGVRVLTARGLEITTDDHGRFHLTCAVVPNPDRGSNFIIKLDERSLPSGYRLTTENPRVVRATRGKMVKFNFGAAIHRVVRLDMADAVFEKGSIKMRPQWLPRLDLLMTELAKDPSLLRLSYLADNESESEVNDRLQAVKDEIEERWENLNCCYQLVIETEVFWRKGAPPDRGGFDD